MSYSRVFFYTLLLVHLFYCIVIAAPNDDPALKCPALNTVNVECQNEILSKLYYVLPHVCKYLDNIRDISSTQSTCRDFKIAAERILANQRPDLKLLMIKGHQEVLSKIIKIRPKVALLFFDKGSLESISGLSVYNSVSHELFGRYVHQLPPDCNLFTIQAPQIFLDLQPVEAEENNAMGAFFPEFSDNQVYVSTITRNQFMPDVTLDEVGDFRRYRLFMQESHHRKMKEFLENILETNTIENTIGMILLRKSLPMGLPVNEILDPELKQILNDESVGNVALWGGIVYNIDSTITGDMAPSFLGMRISGSKVRCWSLVIDMRMKKSNQDTKILEFKNKIQSFESGKSFGLIIGDIPLVMSSEGKRIPDDSMFRNNFPDTKFLTIANSNSVICIDSFGTVPVLAVIHGPKHVCFMMISYAKSEYD